MEARALVIGDRAAGTPLAIRISSTGRTRIAEARPIHAAAVRDKVTRHIDKTEAELLIAIVNRIDGS